MRGYLGSGRGHILAPRESLVKAAAMNQGQETIQKEPVLAADAAEIDEALQNDEGGQHGAESQGNHQGATALYQLNHIHS